MNTRFVAFLLMLAAAAAAPLFAYPLLLVNILCFALIACGYNLLVGYTRNVAFGHSAFIGTSAYVAGHLLASRGWPTELGLLAGVAVTMLLGYVFGMLAIRRQGLYFGMITLAQAQLVYFYFYTASWSGGENGLQGIPRGKLLGVIDLSTDTAVYYFVLVVFVLAFLFIHRVIHSPFGHVLQAIRENENRATSLGYDSRRFKPIVFVLSAMLVGLAGALKAHAFGVVTLTDVHWALGADLLVMVLAGGIGTVWGPVVGAVIVVFLHHFLAERAPSLIYGLMGLLFIACVLACRRGIVGELVPFMQAQGWIKKT